MQPDFPRINASQVLFYEFECRCFTLKSQEGIHKMEESGSYAQIATVNFVQINVRQYTCINVTAQRNLHDSIRNSRNIRKLSTRANSGYQALSSDFSNGPGGEANTA